MSEIITRKFTPFSLNIKGRLVEINRPVVMAILNATPDSFYAHSRVSLDEDEVARRTEKFLADGADWIDIGAFSSRPGAMDIAPHEELRRLSVALKGVRKAGGSNIPVSVDTFRADVASIAVGELGADIINDISGGKLDSDMFATVARLHAPYILMHMRGTPATMQQLTDYPEGVVNEVVGELQESIRRLSLLGVADIIVDPGFGFAKTLEQNYELMSRLSFIYEATECPVLIGVSRKSMVTKLLDIPSSGALSATTALHVAALLQGASVLRVHDPLEATQAVRIVDMMTR